MCAFQFFHPGSLVEYSFDIFCWSLVHHTVGPESVKQPWKICGPIQYKDSVLVVYRRDSYDKDETVMRTSFLDNGYCPTGKITSLYWINPMAKYITIISKSRYHNHNRNKAQTNCMNILRDILYMLICLQGSARYMANLCNDTKVVHVERA